MSPSATTTLAELSGVLDFAAKVAAVFAAFVGALLVLRARAFVVATLARPEIEPLFDRLVIKSLQRQKPEFRALSADVLAPEITVLGDVARALDANTFATNQLAETARETATRERETAEVLAELLGAMRAQGVVVGANAHPRGA